MVQKYDISDVSIINDYAVSHPRNVTLKVGGRSLDRITKCTERTTDLRTIDNVEGKKVLNECYIDLSLTKLRELDSNRSAQDQYIYSRSKFLDKRMINVLMVKLRLEGNDTLDDLDYEYLNALLSWKSNDIFVMPILEFEDKSRTDMVSFYDDFVRKMLEEKDYWTSNINVGMSIPHMYPRRSLENLFEIYADEKPTFIAVDFNNSRMDHPSDVTGTILRHFQKENEEKVFLYGVNVKPYKRGAGNASAWDIYMVHGSFNAIGSTHSKPRAMNVPGDWNSMGRIFDPESVEYRVIDSDYRDTFIEWMKDSYNQDVSADFNENKRSLYPYLKRYNFQYANDVLSQFSSAIRNNDYDFVDGMIDAMPEEMKNVNIMEVRKKRARRSEKVPTSCHFRRNPIYEASMRDTWLSTEVNEITIVLRTLSG